jgi:hypothetical protein
MATRRENPYIWVTWLTKLLSGESQCEWSAWFRAHHKEYDRLPTDLDVAAWTLEHGQLVRTRREQLLAEGYEVFVEDDNAFKRVGKTGIIVSGKPDLVAFRDGNGIIEDCKTGRPRTSDTAQVLVYLLLFPIGNPRCAGLKLSGRVVYRNGALDVPPESLDDAFRERFVTLVQKVGGEKPLPKNPAWTECRFCDIGPADCLYRVDQPPESAEAPTDLF